VAQKLKTTTEDDKNEENYLWDTVFPELLAYLQVHGDCNVPQCYPHNPLLPRWVSEQHNDYDLKQHGELTSLMPLHEAKLDAIGFTWFLNGGGSSSSISSKYALVEDVVSSAIIRPEEARSNKAGAAS
jgi:hypothetical protein